MLLPASLRVWRWIVAVTAVALCSSPLLPLTDTLAPWAPHGADLWKLLRAAPSPALAAVRKNLSQLVGRTNVAPASTEDLAAAIAFYEANNGPLLWVGESGISERGH